MGVRRAVVSAPGLSLHPRLSPAGRVFVGLGPLSQSVTFLMVISGQARERLCHVLSSNISLHNPSCLEGGNEWGEGDPGEGARGAGRGLVRRGLHFLPDRIDKGPRGIGRDQPNSHL